MNLQRIMFSWKMLPTHLLTHIYFLFFIFYFIVLRIVSKLMNEGWAKILVRFGVTGARFWVSFGNFSPSKIATQFGEIRVRL